MLADRLEALRRRLEIPLPPQRWRAAPFVLCGLVVLGVIVRAFWYLTSDVEPALTSTDGYYFAAGVGAATTDLWGAGARVAEAHQHGVVALGALLVEVFGVTRESVFMWMPPLIGALVVVPIFALGLLLGGPWLATLAGLGAAFAPAHVGRTTVGYFDTDMFAVTVPLGVAALLVAAWRKTERLPWSVGGAAVLLASYPFLYDQGRPVALLMTLSFALVGWVVLRLRLEVGPEHWFARAVIVLVVAVLPLPVVWAVPVAVAMFLLMRRPFPFERWVALVALVAVVVTSPAVTSLFRKVDVYTAEAAAETWSERDTTASVAEARVLPAPVMFAKAAGHTVPFVLGLVGLLALGLARPTLGFVGPVLAVGLFAFVGGHRFLVYLAPLLPLGVAWFGVRAVARWHPRWRPLSLGAAVAFVPSALATMPTRPSPVLVPGEVAQLDELGRLASRHDTTIAWWDYGYPIAYHARTRTVADGARRGADAALVAELLLTNDAELTRRLALLMAGAEVRSSEGAAKALSAAGAQRLDSARWLAGVADGSWTHDFQPPGEVYLYLPLRMMPVVPTLAHYRLTGATKAYLARYPNVTSRGRILALKEGLEVDAGTVVMRRRNPAGHWEEKPLRRIYNVAGEGRVREKAGHTSASTVGVFLVELALFVELDAALLDTVWGRLFLLGEPSSQFELISSSPGAKVYRVRPVR